MKKKLAKAAVVASMMVMVALSAAGCGKKVECDLYRTYLLIFKINYL